MNNLMIQATDCTPSIYFSAQENLLEIRGTSYPENTAAFYTPIFSWLEEYFASIEDGDIAVNIEIVYFNSGSSKALLEFFDLLDDAAFRGMGVTVNWIYEQDDDDMREYGEEFVEDFRRIAFRFVKKTK